MLQNYLNKKLPWYFVAVVNFTLMMTGAYVVTFALSKVIDWVHFDAVYVAAGSFWYSVLQYKASKRPRTPN